MKAMVVREPGGRATGVGLTIVIIMGVDPALVLNRMLEIRGSRDVSLAEIAQTLELLRQRRLRAVVTRTFPLEGAEEAHELLRGNALVGRAALLLDA